jgi:hypothetical protein
MIVTFKKLYHNEYSVMGDDMHIGKIYLAVDKWFYYHRCPLGTSLEELQAITLFMEALA